MIDLCDENENENKISNRSNSNKHGNGNDKHFDSSMINNITMHELPTFSNFENSALPPRALDTVGKKKILVSKKSM